MTSTELHEALAPVRELVSLSKQLIRILESERMTHQQIDDSLRTKYLAKEISRGNMQPLKEHNRNQDKINGNH